MNVPPLRRAGLSALLLAALAVPARSTWSIVAVNARTGEVAVASATCIQSTNLRAGVPVVFVGRGAAAAQSIPDTLARKRTIIYEGFQAGNLTPAEILSSILGAGQSGRQYGIASFTGPPVTFSGSGTGAASAGVTGQVGDYAYAIQGNLLTGDEVVLAAEAAFVGTNGDMGQRLLAGMEAARDFGGDGRCSCTGKNPTGCGAPPASFAKSAHCGFMIVARMGDRNVRCDPNLGCARGTYYLTFNVQGAQASKTSPDPVDQLRTRYDGWRLGKQGRADGILSRVDSVEALPADGVTQRTVTVRLRDIDDVPLTTGGALLTVQSRGGPSLAAVGPVVDHGDGSYSFTVTAGTQVGTDTLAITVDEGTPKTTTLFPFLTIRSDAPEALHVGYDRVPAGGTTSVPFVLAVPGRAGAHYVLAASASGTHPGHAAPGFVLPLNPPWLAVRRGLDAGALPGGLGVLDDAGRAEPAFLATPGRLAALAGLRLDWAALVFGGDGAVVTNPVGFDVLP